MRRRSGFLHFLAIANTLRLRWVRFAAASRSCRGHDHGPPPLTTSNSRRRSSLANAGRQPWPGATVASSVVPCRPRSPSGLRHDHDAERQSAAEQRERWRVRASLAQRSIEPTAGEHADQRREYSPHDDARTGTESSLGHCSVSRCSHLRPIQSHVPFRRQIHHIGRKQHVLIHVPFSKCLGHVPTLSHSIVGWGPATFGLRGQAPRRVPGRTSGRSSADGCSHCQVGETATRVPAL